MNQPFTLELLVDFIDDAIRADSLIGPEHIADLLGRFRDIGVSRLHWIYYGEGHGGWLLPNRDAGTPELMMHRYRRNIDLLGNPLRVAVEAGHRLGMEVFGCFKPYEQGMSMVFPEGAPGATEFGLVRTLTGALASLDPFVAANPQMRMSRRMDDLPADIQSIPIRGIRLIKADDSPTRIKKQNLQIWASENNWQYQRLSVPLELRETVEPCARDVRDVFGEIVTPRGQPRRVLTLSGLDLRQKYVLVTTDFTEGETTFRNTGLHMMEALDAAGRPITGVFCNSQSYIYDAQTRDFRNQGLGYDNGFANRMITLDESNASGHAGFIAFCRGRNEYLAAGLCETYPQVTDYWLREVDEILDSGVDGVDFRVENHCMHTDYPEEYGFNDVVLARCNGKGVSPEEVARVRGEAYGDFLRRAKAKIKARGKVMRLHVDGDWWRSDRPHARAAAFPGNMDFPWRDWFDQGLLEQATLRLFHLPFETIYNDPLVAEMIGRCQRGGVPVFVPRIVNFGVRDFLDQFRRLRADGRFAGFQIYEAASIFRLDQNGQWQLKDGMQELLDGIQQRA